MSWLQKTNVETRILKSAKKRLRKPNLYKIFIRQSCFYLFPYPRHATFVLYFHQMIGIFTTRINKREQYLISLLLVLAVSGVCYGIATFLGYRVVAFILLLTVSLIAISFDIFPVLLSAILSAFIWNYFFIPPRFTFHVSTTEDVILFTMYFLIALVNAALTYKIRQVEKASRKRGKKIP
jgi:K+-sensing histidine kinase KdpD